MLRKIIFAVVLIIPLILLGGLNVYKKVTWEEPTDGVLWEERNGRLQAIKVEEDSQGDLNGIRRGDVLYSINDVDIRNKIDLAKILWTAGRSNQKLNYQFVRNQQILAPSLYIEHKGTPIIYFYLALIGLTTLVIALLVFFNARHSFTLPYVFFFFISIIFYSFNIFSPTGHLDSLDDIFYWVDKTALLIFPPLLFHFFLFFPKRRRIPKKKASVFNLLYLPALLLFLAEVFIHLPNFLHLEEKFILDYHQYTDRLALFQFGFFAVMTFVLLISDTIRLKNQVIKKQLKWITYGIGISLLPFTVLYIIPTLALRAPTTAGELSVIFQALIPLTFAFSISRYRLMDLEVILKKAVPLISSYVFIGFLYYVVSSQTELFSENTLITLILGILAIILGATLFTPLKRAVQSVIDRATYRRSYQYRKNLLSISRGVSRERNLQKLSQSILELTANALSLKYVALLLPVDNVSGSFLIFKSRGEKPPTDAIIKLDKDIYERLKSKEFISYFNYMDMDDLQKKFRKLTGFGIFHLLPLKVENRLIGCLAMGRKTDNTYLTSEDTELLITISSPVALSLENAYLFNQVNLRAQELERLKNYSENIIESLPVGVVVLDQKEKIRGWNRIMEETFGISKDMVMDKSFETVLGQKNFIAIFPTDIQQDFRLMSEIAIEMPGGSQRIFNIGKTPLLDNQRKPYGTVIGFEDITEKISLQQQLLTSEKLASIGLLSAGVAHEINTPLTGISSYVQILQKKMVDSPNAQILEKIEAQTERVGRIVKNLLNFARNPSESTFHQVDLGESLKEIIALIEYKLKNMNITLDLDLKPVPSVTAQGEQLQQVFINIILNAIDAMPEGGLLTLSLDDKNDHVDVRIRDNGTGIKRQHLPHIFDPFFTTKGIGKGTGLGLSISYAIIKEHEGRITVESELGKGTLFIISIPLKQRKKKTVKHPE
ncbi:MAG: ATP-binding protein [Acidobacteriota bacterium]